MPPSLKVQFSLLIMVHEAFVGQTSRMSLNDPCLPVIRLLHSLLSSERLSDFALPTPETMVA